ncbi:MAG: hypothetical protein ACKV1O_01115, partial [Saprospiraceae bacterium]
RLFGLPFLPLTWAGFFVPLVVENQRYDTSPLFSLRPIHATKPLLVIIHAILVFMPPNYRIYEADMRTHLPHLSWRQYC